MAPCRQVQTKGAADDAARSQHPHQSRNAHVTYPDEVSRVCNHDDRHAGRKGVEDEAQSARAIIVRGASVGGGGGDDPSAQRAREEGPADAEHAHLSYWSTQRRR